MAKSEYLVANCSKSSPNGSKSPNLAALFSTDKINSSYLSINGHVLCVIFKDGWFVGFRKFSSDEDIAQTRLTHSSITNNYNFDLGRRGSQLVGRHLRIHHFIKKKLLQHKIFILFKLQLNVKCCDSQTTISRNHFLSFT